MTPYYLTQHLRTEIQPLYAFCQLDGLNPFPAKSIYLNFHPLEAVSRYRDPQLQVGENYSYLFNLSTNICKSWCLNMNFITNNSDLIE